jgi:periplasmic protein TonB
MPENMFSTLETTWDRSGRRGWTTLASFTMQALGLSLLIAIPLLWVQRPPQLQWFQPLTSPAAVTPAGPMEAEHSRSTATNVSSPLPRPIVVSLNPQPSQIENAGPVSPIPELPNTGWGSGNAQGARVPGGIGTGFPVVIPPQPVPVKPLVVSHWAEGNIIYRVQPSYPPLARQARVQGTVGLRAIISKSGTIENLVVVHGHPMLSAAAIEAVRQWRYRPYLLNNEPIEVETEITVNFVLSGG